MNTASLLVFAAAIVAFASVSGVARSGRFTAPMMFAGLGLLVGPLVAGVINLDIRNETIVLLAELTLVVALFTDAVRIDVRRLRRFKGLPIRLLGVGLPLTMVLGTFVAWWLFSGFGIWQAAVLAVILGPTDAALGEPVVTANEVHGVVRQGLNVESGLNDGLGLPALLIVASLATVDGASDQGPRDWTLYVLLQLVGGPLVGLATGWMGKRLLNIGHARGWNGEDYSLLALFMLPIAAYTGAELLGANGFLATFACGVVASTGSQKLRDGVDDFTGTVSQLLNAAVFFLVGAVLLPEFLHEIDGRHVLFAGLALTLLRMGPVAIALLGTRLHAGSVLFMGWFGPRGMASVIYLLIVIDNYRLPAIDDIAATVALTVLASIFAHGMTAAPGVRRYASYVGSLKGWKAEDEPVPTDRSLRRRTSKWGQDF